MGPPLPLLPRGILNITKGDQPKGDLEYNKGGSAKGGSRGVKQGGSTKGGSIFRLNTHQKKKDLEKITSLTLDQPT